MVNYKILLGFTVLSSIALFGLYKMNSENYNLGGWPENIQDCDDKADYPLKRTGFKTDKEIKAGDVVTMITNFLPENDGKLNKFVISVFKGGFKLYSKTIKADKSYIKQSAFEYDYKMRLPGFIPHINIQLSIDFYNDDTQLNCLKFDLSV